MTWSSFCTAHRSRTHDPAIPVPPKPLMLLDTSVIIDGRIADVAETGFLLGKLLVPRFVLNELQYIADSSDTLRRNRGRRGLEMLDRLQQNPDVEIEFMDRDPQDAQQVDDKLISLARDTGAAIITNDYNLNRVARLQGVQVLNINELANAVKSVFLPGEEMPIRIIQVGQRDRAGRRLSGRRHDGRRRKRPPISQPGSPGASDQSIANQCGAAGLCRSRTPTTEESHSRSM